MSNEIDSLPLIRTKLYRPRITEGLVPRPRLLERLEQRRDRPLTLVVAPAGYGKSTLVASWLETCGCPSAWLSLFEDEVDLNLLPGIIGCWTRRGQQRRVPTPGQNQKRYGFGAVNFMTGQVMRLIGERKNSDRFCALVEQVVQDYCPGETWQGPKVVIIVDNYIIHRSKKTNQVLAGYADRLTVAPLPTYSPKLNVIELLWKYLRRKMTHNHLFDSIDTLVEAAEAFFAGLDSHPAEVLSVIGCSE